VHGEAAHLGPARGLLDQARFADTGVAADEKPLATALLGAGLQRGVEQPQLAAPADKRKVGVARPGLDHGDDAPAPLGAALAAQPRRHRALHRRGDEDFTGRRRGLQRRGLAQRRPGDDARRPLGAAHYHHLPAGEADAQRDAGAGDQRQRGARRELGIAAARARNAEHRGDGLADGGDDGATELRHGPLDGAAERGDRAAAAAASVVRRRRAQRRDRPQLDRRRLGRGGGSGRGRRGRAQLAGADGGMQRLGRRLRLRSQLSREQVAAETVLAQRRGALATQRVQLHQRAVHVLAQRVERQQAHGGALRRLRRVGGALAIEQCRERAERLLAQQLAFAAQPLLEWRRVDVEAGEQVAAIGRGRGVEHTGGDVGAQRQRIDHHCRRREGHVVGTGVQRAVGQDPAQRRQRLAQTPARLLLGAILPQERGEDVAGLRHAGVKREIAEQRRGLLGRKYDGLVAAAVGLEAAQDAQSERFGGRRRAARRFFHVPLTLVSRRADGPGTLCAP
jgi:hypothetical protein